MRWLSPLQLSLSESRRRRLWLSNRFLDGLNPDPMVRDLAVKDASNVFADRAITSVSLDQDPLEKIVRQVDRPSPNPLADRLLGSSPPALGRRRRLAIDQAVGLDHRGRAAKRRSLQHPGQLETGPVRSSCHD
jgi:hypothetical protein